MATNRDVKMTLSVDTLGEEGIKSLQKSIQSLASEGGTAAPEFQKLADEVGRLGEQSKALTAFKDLGAATEALTTKQAEAIQTSVNLSSKLDALKTSTQEAKTKQQEAAVALAAGQVAAQEAAGELRLLKAEYDNAGKKTVEFKDKQKELITAQTAAQVALVELRTAQRGANAELSAAEAAQKKAETAYTRSKKAIEYTTEALAKQEVVVKEAAAATEALGLSATDVATSEGMLLSALNKVGSEAAQHSAAIKDMAESDRLLAIEEKGLAELFARGANALQAETLAQRDADRSNAEYAASLAKINAEKARSVNTAAQWQREAEAIVNAAEAAQKLERDTIALLNAERQLAANNAFAQQAEDAKKLVQAAEYAQFWTVELDRADAAAKQLQGAFNALNVRSAEAIQADITAVRLALETVKAQATATGQSMSGAFDAGKAKIQALELEMRQLNGTMTMADKTADVLSNSLGQISAGNIVADGVGYLVNKVKEMGQAFLDAVVQGDQMRRGLNAIYKDTAVAAQQIEFLRKTATESGVSLGSLSGEFVRFSASMKSTNVPMAESNALFRAVTAASASLGLGAEATSGALNALGQMASKGTVSMEELRQQLGDRLPGALGLAAQGMGITEGQLIALVSTGGLATRDFIVPFTKALETMRGEVDGLVPTWGRFGTALTTISQNAGDAGWVQILTIALKGLAGVVGTVVMTFSLASEGVIFLSKALTAAAARMMGDKDAFKFLAEEADKAANRINASNAALVAVIDPSKAAATATTAHATAMTANTAAVTKAIAANTALSAEQKLVALSTALAADKTLDASAKLVQYNVAAAELIAKQGQQIESYGKLAKAAKEEGDTLVALAKMTGDVTAVQEAGVKAAEMHAAALELVATAQSAETAMLQMQKAEELAVAATRKGGTDAIKDRIAKLDDLITKSAAETEQSRQASEAAKLQVLEKQVLIQTTKDHAGEVDNLKLAMEQAAVAVRDYEFFAKAGWLTEDAVKVKRQELTVATALYRDSLNDVVTSLNAKQIADKAAASATEIGLNAQKSYYKAMEDGAKAAGDYGLALYANIEQKKIDIALINAKVQAMKAEADGTIAVAKAELAVLDASGKVDPVKRAQIEASITLAEAKKGEAEAMGLSTKGIELQINALRNGTQQLDGFKKSTDNAAGAQTGFASAADGATAALEKQNAALERGIAAREKAMDIKKREKAISDAEKGVDADGFVLGSDGKRQVLQQETQRTVYDRAKGQGLTEEQALKISDDYFKNGEISYNGKGNGPFGTIKTWSAFVQEDIDKYILQNAQKAANDAATTASAAKTSTSTPPTALQTTSADTGTPASKTQSTAQTVNVVINGRSQSVNVASASDAATLTGILRSLESAANTSS